MNYGLIRLIRVLISVKICGSGLGTRDLGGPYQPSIVLIAVTARFSYAAMRGDVLLFTLPVKRRSVKVGSALYQSKARKVLRNHGLLNTLP
jgi:hypothetical protein